ncbi:Ig-like domain-containing protein [Emticicia sp. C21]|uniref:Ig-like domain-containing protein n=1 Tax=Emticicia sp. C21 TaxID=2302915 RepID=UPI000E35395F|nr:Ig-like domain-containing protein [Emticicia sp. C21]RFS18113.1 hypothetical protein D0T08_02365 [Emticicia sp. C21]
MFRKVKIFLFQKLVNQMLLSICLVGFLMGACDNVNLATNPGAGVEENPNDIFYTTKDPITINPTTLDGLENASQISIAKNPLYGEAKFTDNGLVYYRFTSTTTANKDNLILRGRTQSGSMIDKEVQFNIFPSAQDLPCFAGAIGDRIVVEASSTSTLNVTGNDKTCSTISSIQIEIPPKHGTVSLQDQKIVYTAEKDFVGEDTFLYRIGIPNTKNPVAPVELTIIEPKACKDGIKEDVLNLSNYVLGSKIAIDILQNDVICSLYSNATLRIVAQPQNGKISIDTTSFDKPGILYQADKSFSGYDTFNYGLYRDETHFVQAKVSVSIKP